MFFLIIFRIGESEMSESEYSAEWPERWCRSKEKWEEVVRRVKNKQLFDVDFLGWYDLLVVAECGYCEEFVDNPESHVSPCRHCSLFNDNYCSCYKNSNVFWGFVGRMRRRDFCDALEFAQKMLDRIMQDDPEKAIADVGKEIEA